MYKLFNFVSLIYLFLLNPFCASQASEVNKLNKIMQNPNKNIKLEVAIVVDPFSSGALIAGELKKYNIKTISVLSSKNQISYLTSSYKQGDFVDEIVFEGDMDSIVKLISSKYRIQAVIAGAESGVLLADKLANKFNTISNDINQSVARRNKLKMQNAVAAKGLLHIPSIETNDFSKVTKWSKKQDKNKLCSSGYIVKPLQSGGTDGVKYCRDLNETEIAFSSLIKTHDVFGNLNDKVLVQCFIEGQEYVVDTVSIDGKHVVTGVLKYKKIKTESGHLIYDHMDFLNKDTVPEKNIVMYAKNVLTALGIKNGPTHTEIMYTKYGPILIESGARMHGGSNPIYAKACSGNSQLELIPKIYFNDLKNSYYDDVINYSYKLHKDMRIVFLISPGDVEFNLEDSAKKFSSKIKSLKTYYDSHLYLDKEKIVKTTDLLTTPGFIVLLGNKNCIENDTLLIRKFEKDLFENNSLKLNF